MIGLVTTVALPFLLTTPAWAPRVCPGCGVTNPGGKSVGNPNEKRISKSTGRNTGQKEALKPGSKGIGYQTAK
jgi:hypothetical protein